MDFEDKSIQKGRSLPLLSTLPCKLSSCLWAWEWGRHCYSYGRSISWLVDGIITDKTGGKICLHCLAPQRVNFSSLGLPSCSGDRSFGWLSQGWPWLPSNRQLQPSPNNGRSCSYQRHRVVFFFFFFKTVSFMKIKPHENTASQYMLIPNNCWQRCNTEIELGTANSWAATNINVGVF